MYLFFDTETTGLPRYWESPLEDLDNWPRLVQAAWLLYDDIGNELCGASRIIRPDGFVIPEWVARIHGITTQRALCEGISVLEVLREFGDAAAAAENLVGHNINFDERIVASEFLRAGIKNHLAGKNQICTMLASAEYCGIENRYGYKWPKLTELHRELFKTGFDEAHNAAQDVRVTAKCFWEMKRRGIV